MLRLLNRYIPHRMIVLIVIEALLILTSVTAATFVRLGEDAYAAFSHKNGLLKAFFVVLIFQLCLYYNDLYDLRVIRNRRELFIRLLQSFGSASILLALAYYLSSSIATGRGVFIISLFFLFLVISSWRLLFNFINRIKKLKENVLILGSGDAAIGCAKELLNREELGLNVVGFVDDNPQLLGKSLLNPRVIGLTNDLPHLVHKYRVKGIIVAFQERREKMSSNTLLDLKLKGIKIEEVVSIYERATGKIYIENLYPSWLVFSEGFSKSRALTVNKRLFDMFFATLGIILSFPIALVVAILIKLDSKGPLFFKQERVGENDKVFNLLKFRSMRSDAEEGTGPIWAQSSDSRITRVGRFIRLTRLDEIPQFINVLRGDMSFVGPRPERPYFVEQLKKQIPYYSHRHSVKPGITGWAQVKYRYGSSVEDAIEKLKYDLFYVKNISLSLDLLIIFLTVKVILFAKGAK